MEMDAEEARHPAPQKKKPKPLAQSVDVKPSQDNEFANYLEKKLFQNNLNKFSPSCLTNSNRGNFINMLKQTTPREQINLTARVQDYYPKYNQRYETMRQSDKEEFNRLASLVQIQNTIPEFLRKELANEGIKPVITKTRQVLKQDSWVQRTIDNARLVDVDFERLQRIRKIKLDFCEKNSKQSIKEPDLIRKFVPVDRTDLKSMVRDVLSGSFDSAGEDRRLDKLYNQASGKKLYFKKAKQEASTTTVKPRTPITTDRLDLWEQSILSENWAQLSSSPNKVAILPVKQLQQVL